MKTNLQILSRGNRLPGMAGRAEKRNADALAAKLSAIGINKTWMTLE